jgi:hypothetical protein
LLLTTDAHADGRVALSAFAAETVVMRILAFDGRTGASGDMILGALLDAGADPAALSPVEDELGVTYDRGSTTREGIEATTVTVRRSTRGEDDDRGASTGGAEIDEPDETDDADSLSFEELKARHRDEGAGPEDDDRSTDDGTVDEPNDRDGHDPGDGDREGDDPGDGDRDGDDPGDGDRDGDDQVEGHPPGEPSSNPSDPPAEGHGPTRGIDEVRSIVQSMDLPSRVEADALAIFDRLAAGEAAVHGADTATVHFHEVGADDAIADVVGAALLLDDLDPDRVVTTPLAAGGGEVTFSHGTYPVPSPAVTEIAAEADWPIVGGPVEEELLTPTGAAILAHVAEGVETLPTLRLSATGYGAGSKEFPGRPNVFRVLVGDGRGGLAREEIAVLETNLDDASPEVLGSLQESLAEVGALDVTVLPATMKKSRPGHLVKVVTDPANADRVATRLAEETGTLGVREHGSGHRWVADREVRAVEIVIDGEPYEVGVKVATDADGERFDVSAEYEDARVVAAETGRPVREVVQRAECAFEDE